MNLRVLFNFSHASGPVAHLKAATGVFGYVWQHWAVLLFFFFFFQWKWGLDHHFIQETWYPCRLSTVFRIEVCGFSLTMLFIDSTANAAVSSLLVDEWMWGAWECFMPRQQHWEERERKRKGSCRAVVLQRDEKTCCRFYTGLDVAAWNSRNKHSSILAGAKVSISACEWAVTDLTFL